MIIVRLIGGLGNQLFQYAVGRYLAEKNESELKIDISEFKTYKLHKYSLWAFNIQENCASPNEVIALTVRKQGIAEGFLRRMLRRPAVLPNSYIREKNFSFEPDILNLQDGIYLEGYWQSQKYFLDIDSIIRKEFIVKTLQTGKNKELSDQISSCESVSYHVRRGDYVSNPDTNRVSGICSLDYYNLSVKYIAERVNNPSFFIFTDEPEWAHENVNLPYATIIVDWNNADKNYEDLRLMNQCKHNIIANSTFSWWAAWLNQNPDKIVIAPKRWFADEKMNSQTQNLIPEAWVRL